MTDHPDPADLRCGKRRWSIRTRKSPSNLRCGIKWVRGDPRKLACDSDRRLDPLHTDNCRN